MHCRSPAECRTPAAARTAASSCDCHTSPCPPVAAPRSGGRQAHLPQRHLRERRMRVGEAVADLEMVEIVEHGEFMAIAALGERGDEGPRLALEFRALARAVGDADRAAYPGEVAQGAERRLFLGRERDVVAA